MRPGRRSLLPALVLLLGVGLLPAPALRADDEPPDVAPAPEDPAAPAPDEPAAPVPDEPAASPSGEEPGGEGDEAGEEPAAPVLDQIRLVNGALFEGWIREEDDRHVVLEMPSASGGSGRMSFDRARIREIVRGTDRPAAHAAPSSVRDAWYLLRSGGQTLGTRHLTLRHLRTPSGFGWRLEERIHHFARGRHLPPTSFVRSEDVDLAMHPVRLQYREVGEASSEPGGPERYETLTTGEVEGGLWHAIVRLGQTVERREVPVPPETRGRLGIREHLLRRREVGVQEIRFLDAARLEIVQARAGYTALDVLDGAGGVYDEFVWEEGGVRLLSRFAGAEAIEEGVAEGVVAVAVTAAQAEAAETAARRFEQGGEPDLEALPEVGIAFRVPDETWTLRRTPTGDVSSGWRKVAALENALLVADVRVEWDPQGAQAAPGAAEAEARLLQRLRTVCPDLVVREARRPLPGDDHGWRVEVEGTLRGERVRTVGVMMERGPDRVLLLAAAPATSWPAARTAFERLIESLRWL